MKRLYKMLAALGLYCAPLVTIHAQTCNDFMLQLSSNLGSGLVGEIGSAQVCPVTTPNSTIHYSVVSLPDGYTVDNYEDGHECITIHGAAQQAGVLHFIIAAETDDGCKKTLDYTKTFQCMSSGTITPASTMLPNAISGKFYTQDFGLPLSYTVAAIKYEMDSSVPGLTLQSGSNETSAFLSGIPTTPGVYKFTMRGIVGDNCVASEKEYTLMVGNSEAVKSLIIYQMCNRTNYVRNWQIHNPNNFAVAMSWKLLYYTDNVTSIDAITVEPGDTYFETPSTANPNTIEIAWYDGVSAMQSIVKSSFVGLCNPPTCVFASNVVKYTLGLQKNGENISLEENAPTATLGEPDANDAPNAQGKYLSLGYTGFVVLQLSSVLIDQPGNDLIVYEYSAGNPTFGTYPERAEIFVSKDGLEWVSLGLTTSATCQSTLDRSFDMSGKIDWCRYVKVLDKTDRHAKVLDATTCAVTSAWAFNDTSDGFDLDAITCAQDNGDPVLGIGDELTASGKNTALYPNPVRDQLTIDLSKDRSVSFPASGNVEINISDVQGNDVYRTIYTLQGNGVITLEVADLHTGMYILKVRSGSYTSGFYKFMKH